MAVWCHTPNKYGRPCPQRVVTPQCCWQPLRMCRFCSVPFDTKHSDRTVPHYSWSRSSSSHCELIHFRMKAGLCFGRHNEGWCREAKITLTRFLVFLATSKLLLQVSFQSVTQWIALRKPVQLSVKCGNGYIGNQITCCWQFMNRIRLPVFWLAVWLCELKSGTNM